MTPRLDTITTRTGDTGTAALADGSRLPKSHPRFTLLGDLDEAGAALGLAVLHAPASERPLLERLQSLLFDLGADAAIPYAESEPKPRIRASAPMLEWMESHIACLRAGLPPLTSFTLPGGTPLAAHLQLARAILRRAERSAVALHAADPLNPLLLSCLNRLSDLLFLLAREANRNHAEPLWQPGGWAA